MRLIPEQYVTGILPHKMQGPSRLAPRLELRDEGASWFLTFFGQRPLCDGVHRGTFVPIAIRI
jgi:hypothetical protein